jgi:hypothetical protein
MQLWRTILVHSEPSQWAPEPEARRCYLASVTKLR